MIIQLLKNHCRNLLRYISSLLMENHLKINGSFKKEFFFICSCPGSSLLHELFSSCSEWGLFSSCNRQASVVMSQ